MTKTWRRNKVLLCVVPVAIALAAFLFIGAYGRGDVVAEEEQPVSGQTAALIVSVERVRKEEIASTVTATGTVLAWQEGIIGAQAVGLQLTEVLADEGDRVSKGLLVAKLDDTLLRAQLAEQQAAVEQARATLEAAQASQARGQKLLASNAISAETADVRATTVKTATALLAQAEAAADRIGAQVAQTEIHAPFDGIVSTKPAVAGTIVQSGTEIMRILRDGKVEVALQVAEKDLASITVGQSGTITMSSHKTSAGKVSSIAQKVDASTRLGIVYVEPVDISELKPGMFARVTIAVSASEGLSVAESALIWRDGKPIVFVVGADGKATAHVIETGARKNNRVAIVSGVADNDSVVVSGAGFLNDGNLVRVAASASDQTALTTGTVR